MTNRTPLYDRHISLGARMFEFGGWDMPLWYSSIVEEHLTVRNRVGIFDVSHLGKILVTGSRDDEETDQLLTRKISNAQNGKALYSFLPDERGRIIDDLIVTKLSDGNYLIVCNAAKKDAVFNWLHEKNKMQEITDITGKYGCLAIQGPESSTVMKKLLDPDVLQLKRFRTALTRLKISSERYRTTNGDFKWAEKISISNDIEGMQAFISRTGYTGEDGFEIILSAEDAEAAWKEILSAGNENNIAPIGLGARDTLRLEMCYLLSGHDFNGSQTPLEADAEFAIDWDHEFIGKQRLEEQKTERYSRLIAFETIGKGIPREGYPISSDETGEENIGKVTSGTMSPTLKIGIGMGYVVPELASPCKRLYYGIGKRNIECHVVEKNFLKKK